MCSEEKDLDMGYTTTITHRINTTDKIRFLFFSSYSSHPDSNGEETQTRAVGSSARVQANTPPQWSL